MRAVAFALLTVASAAASAQDPAAVLRWAEGSYAYRSSETGEPFGVERFRLTVHGDGTRTLTTWTDNRARATQVNATLRVAADFTPIEAYSVHAGAGGVRGSTRLVAERDRVRVDVLDANGLHSQTLAMSGRFSLATHPVAGDGWHVAAAEGAEGTLMLLALNPAPAPGGGVTAAAAPLPFARLPSQSLRVPAGEFAVDGFKLGGINEVWVHGPDRLVVRQVAARVKAEYVLTCLLTGTGQPPLSLDGCAGGPRK